MHRIRKKSDTLPPFNNRIAPPIMTTIKPMTAHEQMKAAIFAERMKSQAEVYTKLINAVEAYILPTIKKFDGKECNKRLETAIRAAKGENDAIGVYLDNSYSTRLISVTYRPKYQSYEGMDITPRKNEFLFAVIADNYGRIDAEKTLARWEVTKSHHTATRDQWLKDAKRYAKARRMAEKISAMIQEYGETYSQELRSEFWIKSAFYIQ